MSPYRVHGHDHRNKPYTIINGRSVIVLASGQLATRCIHGKKYGLNPYDPMHKTNPHGRCGQCEYEREKGL
jgi:hypothetical protein